MLPSPRDNWYLEHYLQFIPLNTSPFLVGRGVDAGLNLALSVISRHHAELVWHTDACRWQLRDLGSRNGTFLNDKPLAGEQAALENGDWLRFASVEVRLVQMTQPRTMADGNQQTDMLHRLPDKTLSIREKIERCIHHNIRLGSCTVQDLADSLNVERTTMYRHIMSEFGQSPSDLLRDKRLEYAAQLLKDKGLSVQQASDASGFESAAHFSRAFKKHFSVSPSRYLSKED